METSNVSGGGARSILLVHGRDFKPAEQSLLDISLAALSMASSVITRITWTRTT